MKMTNLNLKLARTLIQVLAFGILLFQIQNSVRKYWEEPVFSKSNLQPTLMQLRSLYFMYAKTTSLILRKLEGLDTFGELIIQ